MCLLQNLLLYLTHLRNSEAVAEIQGSILSDFPILKLFSILDPNPNSLEVWILPLILLDLLHKSWSEDQIIHH